MLRVGLLAEERRGVIATRNPGAVEFEATLEWPPEAGGGEVLGLLPTLDDERGGGGRGVYGPLREYPAPGATTVSGTLRSLSEDLLCSAVDETLRAVTEVAATHEAILRAGTRRTGRACCPSSDAVQAVAGILWRSGLRVGFGPSLNPATPGADVMVGCGGTVDDSDDTGDTERLVRALEGKVVARTGAPS